MNRWISISLFLLLCGITGCAKEEQSHGHDHGMADGGHGHAHDEFAVSHTVWTDKSELFVEYKPLVVGEVSTFTAHFSEMENFKALTEAEVTVSLIKGKKGIRHKVDGPSSPGIFRPALQPKEVGMYKLIFDLQTPDYSDKIVFDGIQVFASMKEAKSILPPMVENPNGITFFKEQAWKIDFANAPVRRDTIYEVIRAGGEIISTLGNEKTISSTADGIVIYKKHNANMGSAVAKGELLFAIAGGGIIDRDLEARFLKAKATYEQAGKNLERKEELYSFQAIAKPEYEKAQLEFDLAKTEYELLSSSYSKGGKSIYASQQGYLKQLFKTEGSFVEAGEPLALISEDKTVSLKADVGTEYYSKLNAIHSATFISNQKTYTLEELNGRLLSYGKGISRENPKVPVFFELANTVDLLPGSFVEVFISLRPVSNGLLIPNSALLEEYGNFKVVVQTKGESFELRDIKIGIRNGRDAEVISGLSEGERVVTKGAFQVKMASMGGTVPAHGHSH